MTHFETYLDKINRQFQTGKATEHSYRAPFQNYLEALFPRNVTVINEAARQKVGAPDFIIQNAKGIPVAYIEAKDIGKNLRDKAYHEQFERYKRGLDTLLITDYLEFHLYKRGVLTQSVTIAQSEGNRIARYSELYESNTALVARFESLIQHLIDIDGVNITIKSSDDLARRMAGKARLFADTIYKALELNDNDFEIAEGSLSNQYKSFKTILLGEITYQEFADIYAQTVTYGLFAARLHDQSLEDFSRQEAAELIPKSNPFLRKLFQYVASNDLDPRIRWIVDDLAEVFRHADVAALLKDFGKSTQQTDPIIHFYETFLAAYDASLRKARGVWYTPQPVVQFIVRAVDDILKADFALRDGLADTATTRISTKVHTNDGRRKSGMADHEIEVPRVQILDPACGTGTFLAEIISYIHRRFEGQHGIWNEYVERNLIPRLHGFELLMASYAMAHIKLDLLLRESGYTVSRTNRFKIYLTNSLEEHHKEAGTLFWAQWLSDEAAHADRVKRDAPVMVVVGNPPYSGESINRSDFIMNLLSEYKREPSGGKLQERNSKWLNDDYVKFLRLGEHFIEKQGDGVLAYINNHSFLDNPTFRGMRYHLLKTFDKIYIIDLHGNAKKKEVSPDGSPDQNVFDIQQGVSINIFVKTGQKKKAALADVLHYDCFGKREPKYDFLHTHRIATTPFVKLSPDAPNFFFVQKDTGQLAEYEKGFALNELFVENGVGITTAHDEFVISDDKQTLLNRFNEFKNAPADANYLHETFSVRKKDGWNILDGWRNLQTQTDLAPFIQRIAYRPFDIKYIFYENKLVWRTVSKIMRNFIDVDNVGLISARSNKSSRADHFFISKNIMETKCGESTTQSCIFPLYISNLNQTLFNSTAARIPNLDASIIAAIDKIIERTFVHEPTTHQTEFAPIDVLDYIYAVLHTPSYRERYREFLKIDFPRVPYPRDAAQWDALRVEGSRLRRLHLLESDELDSLVTKYPVGGDNMVGKPVFENGKVRINVAQYIEGVSEAVWSFYIGGYQPAQKWLKDRIGRKLTYDEIKHYQRMITALTHTIEIMQRLDNLAVLDIPTNNQPRKAAK